MLINSQSSTPKMPEHSFYVGELLVRRVAESAELVVYAVTKAGVFLGNINQTWYRHGRVVNAFYTVVGADGVRRPDRCYSSLTVAAQSLAPAGVATC